MFKTNKTNNNTATNQVINIVKEVAASLSTSTINRRLHECKYSTFTTMRKPLGTLKSRKDRLDFSIKLHMLHISDLSECYKTDRAALHSANG